MIFWGVVISLLGTVKAVPHDISDAFYSQFSARVQSLQKRFNWLNNVKQKDLIAALVLGIPDAHRPFYPLLLSWQELQANMSEEPWNAYEGALNTYVGDVDDADAYVTFERAGVALQNEINMRAGNMLRYSKTILPLRNAIDERSQLTTMEKLLFEDMSLISDKLSASIGFIRTCRLFPENEATADEIVATLNTGITEINNHRQRIHSGISSHLDLNKALSMYADTRHIYYENVQLVITFIETVKTRYRAVANAAQVNPRIVAVQEELPARQHLLDLLRDEYAVMPPLSWRLSEVHCRTLVNITLKDMNVVSSGVIRLLMDMVTQENRDRLDGAYNTFLAAIGNYTNGIRNMWGIVPLTEAAVQAQETAFDTFVTAIDTYCEAFKSTLENSIGSLSAADKMSKRLAAIKIEADIKKLMMDGIMRILYVSWYDFQYPGIADGIAPWHQVRTSLNDIQYKFNLLYTALKNETEELGLINYEKVHTALEAELNNAFVHFTTLDATVRAVHRGNAPAAEVANKTYGALRKLENFYISGLFPVNASVNARGNLHSGHKIPVPGFFVAATAMLLMA